MCSNTVYIGAGTVRVGATVASARSGGRPPRLARHLQVDLILSIHLIDLRFTPLTPVTVTSSVSLRVFRLPTMLCLASSSADVTPCAPLDFFFTVTPCLGDAESMSPAEQSSVSVEGVWRLSCTLN